MRWRERRNVPVSGVGSQLAPSPVGPTRRRSGKSWQDTRAPIGTPLPLSSVKSLGYWATVPGTEAAIGADPMRSLSIIRLSGCLILTAASCGTEPEATPSPAEKEEHEPADAGAECLGCRCPVLLEPLRQRTEELVPRHHPPFSQAARIAGVASRAAGSRAGSPAPADAK